MGVSLMGVVNYNFKMAGFLDACQHCCYYCLRGLYWVPVGFVVLILTWGYYVYVYTLHLSGKAGKEENYCKLLSDFSLLIGEFVKPIPVSGELLVLYFALFIYLFIYIV